ncbi:MAG: hypothetical protein HYY32_06760 [Chloroflexi bacterium]|nr:hypothetical protein [Chloroflexota bacterium]
MGVKILWLMEHPGDAGQEDAARPDKDLVYGNMLKFMKSVARPGTEIDVRHVEHGTHANWLLYPRTVAKVNMLNMALQAEKEGYDAVFGGLCFGDFCVEEIRQAVTIPVLGAGESAMLLAQLVGKRFAIVTVAPRYLHPFEWNIRVRGWEDRAIEHRPVRYFEPWYWDAMVEAHHGRPEKLIASFEKVALECIADGADTIICGCAPCGATLAMNGYHQVAGTGVPPVPAVAAEVKLAETMVDLRRSCGLTKTEAEVGPFRTTPPDVVDRIQKDFGFAKSNTQGGCYGDKNTVAVGDPRGAERL